MLYILCYCSSLIKKFCNARDYILFLIQINGRIASLTHDFYCCFVTFQSLCQQLIVRRRQNKLCINASVSLSAALCGTSWSVPFHNYNLPRSASTALHASISPGSGLSTRTCPFPDGPVLSDNLLHPSTVSINHISIRCHCIYCHRSVPA